MKIITASNGKKTLKMSRQEWENIGKKAGWKVSQIIPDDGYADGGEPYTDDEMKLMNGELLIARWETRGKRYWAELYKDKLGYSYKTDSGGGNIGSLPSDEIAIKTMENKLSYLTPDAAKNLMKRVK